jgi:hypothetical protein
MHKFFLLSFDGGLKIIAQDALYKRHLQDIIVANVSKTSYDGIKKINFLRCLISKHLYKQKPDFKNKI